MNHSIHIAAKIIRDRGVVIYPTETVYGIGADALSGTAVRKVFAIKKRPSPVSLAVSGYGMIEDVSVCDADTMELIRKLLPGPITVILEKKQVVPDILTAGSDRVGIRYPDHEITIRLTDLSGTPVTSTSANLPGEPPAREVCEISADVLDSADCVIDGGRCVWGRFNRCRSYGYAGSSEGRGVRAGCEIPAVAVACSNTVTVTDHRFRCLESSQILKAPKHRLLLL